MNYPDETREYWLVHYLKGDVFFRKEACEVHGVEKHSHVDQQTYEKVRDLSFKLDREHNDRKYHA